MSVAIFDDRPCHLGEGPLWHPLRQQLFWFDILERRMLSRRDGAALEWQFDEMASAAGWVDADTLLIATETGLIRFDPGTGRQERLADIERDNAVTRSNDGRADPMGGFWIGTMGKRAEPGAGAIYRFHGGEVRCLVEGVSIPNSICFREDGRLAYWADTAEQRIFRTPLDPDGWPEGPHELFLDLAPEGIHPDGSVVDAEGGLWNARWGAGQVARYLPDGTPDRVIDLPASRTTCPAFGGPGFGRLFVTSAREGLSAPHAEDGTVFELAAPVAGRPESRVRL
ncbi:SMP-30/gluconolactonase/LRE family protein [Salipiger sp.]|uniref:SMP-30/gluconolactonase/LRE family protein n=1 Tax=Salipiger sp. TaxID=2078585 RepID=UPI003A97C3BE